MIVSSLTESKYVSPNACLYPNIHTIAPRACDAESRERTTRSVVRIYAMARIVVDTLYTYIHASASAAAAAVAIVILPGYTRGQYTYRGCIYL